MYTIPSGHPATRAKLTSAACARIAPDIHARVLAGELTPHAGMTAAGSRKKRPGKKQSATPPPTASTALNGSSASPARMGST
jgi:hypothetical protein